MVSAEEEAGRGRVFDAEYIVVSGQDVLWSDFVRFLRRSRLIKELFWKESQKRGIDISCHNPSII